MKAIIFAAGLGTRLKPLTNNMPKAMVEIGGKPLLRLAIEKLIHSGISNIVINVHHFAKQIETYLTENNNFGIDIIISDESVQLLDTGGGLKKASTLLESNEPILIYNVDILSNIDLSIVLKHHQLSGSYATLVVRERETQRYLMFDKQNRLTGWKNFKTGETKVAIPDGFENAKPFAFSGIHIIDPKLPHLLKGKGKFPIIKAYLNLAAKYKITGFIDDSSLWMDLGKPEQLEKAKTIIQQNSD